MSSLTAQEVSLTSAPSKPNVNKTPVTFLQELCTKRGITPEYQLLASEGPVHKPQFIFAVKAGDLSASAKGSSKKQAKHNAASELLSQMLPQFVAPVSVKVEIGNDESDTVNPVGELQELTQKKLWPPPIYECASEDGQPHERSFTCTVRLFGYMEMGRGKSKKLAKRNAAINLLNILKSNANGDEANEVEWKQSDIEAQKNHLQSLEQTVEMLKGVKRIPTLTPQDSQAIARFYQGLKYRTGKTLASLQVLALNISATNYCQMLQEIAEEQKFDVTYVDIQHLSFNGECQCIVQLSTMPVAVCHGTGPTKEESHSVAAHNALQYLKIMTRKL